MEIQSSFTTRQFKGASPLSTRKIRDFSVLLAATSPLAAPAQPLPYCHLLHVSLFCMFPRGGGSPLLPLLLTTDSSSHGNHQFSPGMGSLTYTANRNPTKQVSIRTELVSIPACYWYATKKKRLSSNCQPDQTNPKEKDLGRCLHFPSLVGVLPNAFTLTSRGYLPCQISEGTVLRTPAGV